MDKSSSPNLEAFFIFLIALIWMPIAQVLNLRRMTIFQRSLIAVSHFWVPVMGALLIDLFFGQNIWGAGWQYGIGAMVGITLIAIGAARFYAWRLELMRHMPKENQVLWAQTLGFYDSPPEEQDNQKKDKN